MVGGLVLRRITAHSEILVGGLVPWRITNHSTQGNEMVGGLVLRRITNHSHENGLQKQRKEFAMRLRTQNPYCVGEPWNILHSRYSVMHSQHVLINMYKYVLKKKKKKKKNNGVRVNFRLKEMIIDDITIVFFKLIIMQKSAEELHGCNQLRNMAFLCSAVDLSNN